MRDVESVSWRCLAGVYAYGTAHPGTTSSATLRLTSRMLGRPRVGGRLMFPLQPVNGMGGMLLVTQPAIGAAWPARFVSRAIFIGCAGRQDEVTSRSLVDAFSKGRADTVRSLRLDRKPDATCWCAGDDWWLSTKAPDEPSAATLER